MLSIIPLPDLLHQFVNTHNTHTLFINTSVDWSTHQIWNGVCCLLQPQVGLLTQPGLESSTSQSTNPFWDSGVTKRWYFDARWPWIVFEPQFLWRCYLAFFLQMFWAVPLATLFSTDLPYCGEIYKVTHIYTLRVQGKSLWWVTCVTL